MYYDIDSSLIIPGLPYKISIELVNNGNYPYQNIWFFISDNINDSSFVSSSKQYMLADKFGRWYGSGFGSTYQLSLDYIPSVIFEQKRNYRIKIVHGMRDELLEGIEKIGIKIEKPQ